MTPLEMAAQLIAEAESGFRDEFHWLGWKKKHAATIRALPIGLRNKVVLAWEQASAKEFSESKGKQNG